MTYVINSTRPHLQMKYATREFDLLIREKRNLTSA